MVFFLLGDTLVFGSVRQSGMSWYDSNDNHSTRRKPNESQWYLLLSFMLFSEAVRPPILEKTHPPGWWNRSTSGYPIHHLHQPHATSEKYVHDIVKLRPSKMNNNFAPENGWLGNDPFILGRFIFRCEVLSSARAIFLFYFILFFLW